jgi:hypothetical protein
LLDSKLRTARTHTDTKTCTSERVSNKQLDSAVIGIPQLVCSNAVVIVNFRWIGWVMHVACLDEMRNKGIFYNVC